MASTAEIVTPPADAPEGTCQPVPGQAPWWFVKGSQEWHVVNADTGDCDCASYVWRCSRSPGALCKHGRRLQEHLEEQAACPLCRGQGWLVPSGAVRYVDRDGKLDMEPKACIECGGSGQRNSDG